MAKGRIYTRDGDTHEVEITNERDARWVDDLPFESDNVTRTTVTDDDR